MKVSNKKIIIILGILVFHFILLGLFLGEDRPHIYKSTLLLKASLFTRNLFLPMTYVTISYLIMELLRDRLPFKGLNRKVQMIGKIVLSLLLLGYLLFSLNLVGLVPYLFHFITIPYIDIIIFLGKSTNQIPYLLIWVILGIIASLFSNTWKAKE